MRNGPPAYRSRPPGRASIGWLVRPSGSPARPAKSPDSTRRLMRDGSMNKDRLVYELGDLVFHWACLVAELGQSPSALLARSREQIEARLAARATPTVERHP